ncbi:MAG: aspartate aminotransferase family protein [Actinomycetota bacterium]|nr:aspartate aminotransferase family protein [Actinomycetota bacterium]
MAVTTDVDPAELRETAREHLLLHFARNGGLGPRDENLLVLERGEGPYVFDVDGKRHFDSLSSLFCAQIGYSYGEEMATAASAQLTKLAFGTNWGVAHPGSIELARRLAEIAPGDINRAFFTSGGSESVEAAWKLVRQYHVARGEPQRCKAIARDRAYHGVTLGALSFTGVPNLKETFGPPAIPVRHVSWTNQFRPVDGLSGEELSRRLLAEIEDAIAEEGSDTVAAIIAEPVQNAGGCLTAPAGYWTGLRQICDRHGILLIADEVICAFGRIGEWFASERYDARPDLITVAKGLTSAYMPMGAVLVSDQVAEPLYEDKSTLLHGITFGGHPVACAVALRNLDIFERDGILNNVRALEPWLKQRLDKELLDLPIVVDVRGAGFFWAFELAAGSPEARFDADQRERLLRGFLPIRLREAGLIARPDDRGDPVLQIAPPLISTAEQLDEMTRLLRDVLADAGTFMGLC